MATGAGNSDAARGIELLEAGTTIAGDAGVQVLADSACGSGSSWLKPHGFGADVWRAARRGGPPARR
ncbi:hypothetical protein GALL_361930 [mine drainage metagenome]|uniref:Uncharacterized protein n=1 Tax=mine drainage metagenome TaxID=410659 RepID=A0A1J5QER3_9ZZZZ